MFLIERISLWLREKRILQRESTPTERKALSVALNEGCMSCEKAGQAVGVSRQAVKDWFASAAWYFRCLGGDAGCWWRWTKR